MALSGSSPHLTAAVRVDLPQSLQQPLARPTQSAGTCRNPGTTRIYDARPGSLGSLISPEACRYNMCICYRCLEGSLCLEDRTTLRGLAFGRGRVMLIASPMTGEWSG